VDVVGEQRRRHPVVDRPRVEKRDLVARGQALQVDGALIAGSR
jgi:hypothetical protein